MASVDLRMTFHYILHYRAGDRGEQEALVVSMVIIGVHICCELRAFSAYDNLDKSDRLLHHFGTKAPLFTACANSLSVSYDG